MEKPKEFKEKLDFLGEFLSWMDRPRVKNCEDFFFFFFSPPGLSNLVYGCFFALKMGSKYKPFDCTLQPTGFHILVLFHHLCCVSISLVTKCCVVFKLTRSLRTVLCTGQDQAGERDKVKCFISQLNYCCLCWLKKNKGKQTRFGKKEANINI